jgi:predicted RND superfamily exporter protein
LGIHDRIEAAFASWGHFVVFHRRVVALAVLAITAALGAWVPRLEADNSTESFLRAGDPARLHYDAFREQFGQDDQIVVVIRPREIFDLGFLNELRALHREIAREVPHVDEITSLWNARNTRGEGDQLIVEDLLARWPESPADLEALRARVFETPLYVGNLIDPDGELTAIIVSPSVYSDFAGEDASLGGFEGGDPGGGAAAQPEFLSERESFELIDALQAVIERHQRPDFEVHVAGGMVANRAMTRYLIRDVAVFLTGGVAVIAALLFVLFRRISGVILPLLVVLLSGLATYGTMALAGVPTSISGQMLPVLVLTVGVCAAVHVLTITYQRLAAGESRADAIAYALGHSGFSILMTSLTTAGGLVSFAWADLAQVRDLGIAAPIGIALALAYNMTLLPALLAMLPLRRGRSRSDALQRRLGRALARVGVASSRHPGAVQVGTALVVLIAGVGVVHLRFAQNGLEWFPEQDPVRRAAEFMNAELGGASSVEVWIDTGRENALQEPALLRRLDDAIRFAKTVEEGDDELFVGKAFSIVDVVKETHKALNENRPEFYAIPDDRRLVAQELLLFANSGSDDLERLVDSRFRMARVSLRTPSVDGLLYPPFMERIEAGFRERLGDDVKIRMTGIASLLGRAFSVMSATMARSYAIALVIITPLMILVIGDMRRGVLSMIPNLVPIWLTLGLMGWLDIAIDNSTLLVGCVLIGLAVDDTIHFMHRFRRAYAIGGDVHAAVRQTLATTGAALLFTSLVLSAGFAVMLLAYMRNAVDFGKLAVFAIAVAFLADALISPALMALATGREARAPEAVPAREGHAAVSS